MDDPESKSGGAVGSLRRIVDSFFAILFSRLQLAAIELQEERIRVVDLLLQAALVVVLGILALVSATATLVVIFWDTSPVLTLLIITAVYVLGTVLAWWTVRERLKNGPAPFADTLAEFKKDREWFQNRQ